MTDIVDRLNGSLSVGYSELRKEAAVTITRLRAKLEAAEKKHDDVAQQLVQSEITRREISEAHNAVTRRLSVLADENTTLRAKIAEMEKQEPVGRALLCVRCSAPFDGEYYCPACGHHTATEETVYALPGAQTQGEEK